MQESQMYTEIEAFRILIDFIEERFEILDPYDLKASTDLSKSDQPRALITFDDAWLGTYDAIIEVLSPKSIRPILFTNFHAVENGIDFSAFVSWRNRNKNSASNIELDTRIMEEFMNSFDDLVFHEEYYKFQGELINSSQLWDLANKDLCAISNHLYRHFDCRKLDLSEFIFEFENNRKKLSVYPNFLDFFAFPYGDPDLNSRGDQVAYLKKQKIPIFWAHSKINQFIDLEQIELSRIGIQNENVAELWLKLRRARPAREGRLNVGN
jgi:hypothetical protein